MIGVGPLKPHSNLNIGSTGWESFIHFVIQPLLESILATLGSCVVISMNGFLSDLFAFHPSCRPFMISSTAGDGGGNGGDGFMIPASTAGSRMNRKQASVKSLPEIFGVFLVISRLLSWVVQRLWL